MAETNTAGTETAMASSEQDTKDTPTQQADNPEQDIDVAAAAAGGAAGGGAAGGGAAGGGAAGGGAAGGGAAGGGPEDTQTTDTPVEDVASKQTSSPEAEDQLILHQFPRGVHAPSMSNFPIKMETFLRIAKIPFKNDLRGKRSPKGKIPWITLKGSVVSDSEFALKAIKQEHGVDLDAHLTAQQQAQARVLRRMVDEAFYWIGAAWRFQFGFEKNKELLDELFKDLIPGPAFVRPVAIKMIQRNFVKNLWVQGTGRHTAEEVWEIGNADLQAFSDWLGDQPYMMGDRISEVDCAMFGGLCQALYHSKGCPCADYMIDKTPNLVQYVERIKREYWPDWDQCLATAKI